MSSKAPAGEASIAVGRPVMMVTTVLPWLQSASRFHERWPPGPPGAVAGPAARRSAALARQLQHDQPPQYTAIIHEAALRMRFGGRDVARPQLEHLSKMSEQPHITLRVIPFDGTVFPTVGHGLDYAYGPVPALDTAQLDAAHGSELIHAAAQLTRYRLILDRMKEAALEPNASRDLIHHITQDT
ncbi:DUF5753 domain-containing protein [Streptomyces umbrinus]|uniref:DUF5753 domain-containing protein n=1 Tax=Streptomyces umbrinus TaxID=67370 RepID=UPI0033D506A7